MQRPHTSEMNTGQDLDVSRLCTQPNFTCHQLIVSIHPAFVNTCLIQLINTNHPMLKHVLQNTANPFPYSSFYPRYYSISADTHHSVPIVFSAWRRIHSTRSLSNFVMLAQRKCCILQHIRVYVIQTCVRVGLIALISVHRTRSTKHLNGCKKILNTK